MQGLESGKLVNLAVFYGSTENHLSRAEKDASNPNLITTIPPVLFRIFDGLYVYPKQDMRSPLLSPGLAPDQLLRDAFPEELVLINCGGDQLLAEEERFRKRLQGLGKRVDGVLCRVLGMRGINSRHLGGGM